MLCMRKLPRRAKHDQGLLSIYLRAEGYPEARKLATAGLQDLLLDFSMVGRIQCATTLSTQSNTCGHWSTDRLDRLEVITVKSSARRHASQHFNS